MMKVLRIDSGADHHLSVSRGLADALTAKLEGEGATIITRDVAAGMSFVDGDWVRANFGDGDPSGRALSDELVDELLSADALILVCPVYNFGVPAAMKAWIDQVVRMGRTFELTESGPRGLASNLRKAWIITASSSTEIGGSMDFNTPYLSLILGVIGVGEVEIISAGQWMQNGDTVVADAHRVIDLTSATALV